MEAGVEFFDCGGGGYVDCAEPVIYNTNPSPGFQTQSACLLEAWSTCRPVTAVLFWNNLYFPDSETTRFVYVYPRGAKCKLVVFEFESEGNHFDRLDCEELAVDGACGVMEPRDCTLVEEY